MYRDDILVIDLSTYQIFFDSPKILTSRYRIFSGDGEHSLEKVTDDLYTDALYINTKLGNVAFGHMWESSKNLKMLPQLPTTLDDIIKYSYARGKVDGNKP